MKGPSIGNRVSAAISQACVTPLRAEREGGNGERLQSAQRVKELVDGHGALSEDLLTSDFENGLRDAASTL
jgi:hypothetical protein